MSYNKLASSHFFPLHILNENIYQDISWHKWRCEIFWIYYYVFLFLYLTCHFNDFNEISTWWYSSYIFFSIPLYSCCWKKKIYLFLLNEKDDAIEMVKIFLTIHINPHVESRENVREKGEKKNCWSFYFSSYEKQLTNEKCIFLSDSSRWESNYSTFSIKIMRSIHFKSLLCGMKREGWKKNIPHAGVITNEYTIMMQEEKMQNDEGKKKMCEKNALAKKKNERKNIKIVIIN